MIIEHQEKREVFWNYWNNEIPSENHAWYQERQAISFDQILAFDEIGDAWNEKPHLLVEYLEKEIPFRKSVVKTVHLDKNEQIEFTIQELTKVEYFPKKIS
jgi:hypothetical protein